MACTIGIFNQTNTISHLYEVMRNPTYNVGKPFPNPKIFVWLYKFTKELNTTELFDGGEANEMDHVYPQESTGVNEPSVEEVDSVYSVLEVVETASEPHKRVVGRRILVVNSEKMLKVQQHKSNLEDRSLEESIEGWTNVLEKERMDTGVGKTEDEGTEGAIK